MWGGDIMSAKIISLISRSQSRAEIVEISANDNGKKTSVTRHLLYQDGHWYDNNGHCYRIS